LYQDVIGVIMMEVHRLLVHDEI